MRRAYGRRHERTDIDLRILPEAAFGRPAVPAARLRSLCSNRAFLERVVVRNLAAGGHGGVAGGQPRLALRHRDSADVRLGGRRPQTVSLPAGRSPALRGSGRADLLVQLPVLLLWRAVHGQRPAVGGVLAGLGRQHAARRHRHARAPGAEDPCRRPAGLRRHRADVLSRDRRARPFRRNADGPVAVRVRHVVLLLRQSRLGGQPAPRPAADTHQRLGHALRHAVGGFPGACCWASPSSSRRPCPISARWCSWPWCRR